MEKLIHGVHRFHTDIFLSRQELFERLAQKDQAPEALFICCSDSRVVPNLITQAAPGDLFILQNAGNMVPAYGAVRGGEAATIEYAVDVLHVKEIIVCGHMGCGAVQALLDPEGTARYKAVSEWLEHAEATRRVVTENYPDRTGKALLETAVEEHVLTQIENLQTHPAIAAKVARGSIRLHAWVYDIAQGIVSVYDPEEGQYVPLVAPKPLASSRGVVPSPPSPGR